VDSSPTKTFDTREILWKMRRYAWIAIMPVVACSCAAFLYLRLTTPVYQSSVLVTLGNRTQLSAAIEPMVRSDGNRGESVSEQLSRVRNRIMNRSFLQDLARRSGYLEDPRLRAFAAEKVRKLPDITVEEFAQRHASTLIGKKIRIEPSGANNIRIAVRDRSPAIAQRLAGAVADGLIEDTRRATIGRLEARGSFSQDQIAVYSDQVRRDEEALRRFEEEMIVTETVAGAVGSQNIDLVRQLIDSAEKEMDQVRVRIQSDRGTWAANAAGAPLPKLDSPTITELTGRLNSLETNYATAAIRKREGNDEAQQILAQIAGVRQDLLRAFEAAASATASQSMTLPQAQLAAGISLDTVVLRSVRARQERLEALRDRFLQQARATPRQQMERERLRNNLAMSRENLSALQKEATSSRLSEALETSQMNLRIEVIEAPMLPLYPVWPDRVKVLLGGLVGGLFIAVVLIMGMERVGAIVRTVEEAERELGVKVIGTIPRIEGWARPGSFVQNHWAPLSIATLILLTALVTGIHSTLTSTAPRAPRASQTTTP